MSFAGYKDKVEEGDTVILFLGFDNMHTIQVKKKDTFQTKYGALRHSDLIGVRYGSRVHCSKGYLTILHPTPELWTVNLPHRTQILYTTDISMVTMQLDLKPGAVVVESGTGSASLSHALIRSIAPTGHLYTFEFHEQRAQKAREEFVEHGVADLVTVTHRDVCKDGFDLEHLADAVFLDLPGPWEAVPSAKRALKNQGGRLCSFSPCIEQVQKTYEILNQQGFFDIRTFECLVRNFDIRTINLPIADLGAPEPELSGEQPPKKLHTEEGEAVIKQTNFEDLKKATIVTSDTRSMEVKGPEKLGGGDQEVKMRKQGKKQWRGQGQYSVAELSQPNEDLIGRKTDKNFLFKSGIPPKQMPGHTGFLTFATLYPS